MKISRDEQQRLRITAEECRLEQTGERIAHWKQWGWFPVNYLLIESLQKYQHYVGNDFKVAFPAETPLPWKVATELSRRLSRFSCETMEIGVPSLETLQGFRTSFGVTCCCSTRTATGDTQAWKIVDSCSCTTTKDVQGFWIQDMPGSIKQADENYPNLHR